MLAAISPLDAAGVVGIVVGVLAALGAAWVLVRSGMTQGTITALKENNAALHEQNDLQAHQIELLQTRVTAQDAQIEKLAEMSSAKQGISDLSALVAGYHRDVMAAIGTRP
jgi:hypothetical protein